MASVASSGCCARMCSSGPRISTCLKAWNSELTCGRHVPGQLWMLVRISAGEKQINCNREKMLQMSALRAEDSWCCKTKLHGGCTCAGMMRTTQCSGAPSPSSGSHIR